MIDRISKRSILVVVSHDYGELGYAYDFTHKLEHSYNVYYSLPTHIYQRNKDLENFNCIEYHSESEILAAYKSIDPDYIFLFSAFLLVPNKIFSTRSLRSFISLIIRDKKVAITSDPFLGITGSVVTADINPDLINPAGNKFSQYILKYLTCRQFLNINSTLSSIPRLVPFGLNYLDDDSGYHSYYNNYQETNSPELQSNPYWLFAISEIDYTLQKKNMSDSKFIECLLDKLTETSSFGKKPVVLAPQSLLEKIKKVKPSLEYINRCNIIEHKSLVSNAERVFYWNMISHSIYHRNIHYKPVHFFDRGHIHRMFPRLHNLAMRNYYQGKEPDMVEYTKPLNVDTLIENNERFYSTRMSDLKKLSELPDSLRLLQKLQPADQCS